MAGPPPPWQVFELAEKFDFALLRGALSRRLQSSAMPPLLEKDPQGWLDVAERWVGGWVVPSLARVCAPQQRS